MHVFLGFSGNWLFHTFKNDDEVYFGALHVQNI